MKIWWRDVGEADMISLTRDIAILVSSEQDYIPLVRFPTTQRVEGHQCLFPSPGSTSGSYLLGEH
jgi:hypothetical protein